MPLNRAIYTAFSYCLFISLVLCYVYEPATPYIYWVDGALAVFITSYFFRDIGTACFLWRLEEPNQGRSRLVPQIDCTITEKAPSRSFSWLKAPTSAFTFKTLC